jgi:hypothetical protein
MIYIWQDVLMQLQAECPILPVSLLLISIYKNGRAELVLQSRKSPLLFSNHEFLFLMFIISRLVCFSYFRADMILLLPTHACRFFRYSSVSFLRFRSIYVATSAVGGIDVTDVFVVY